MTVKEYDYLPQDAVFIRTEVFVKEQGFNDEFDEKDNNSIHIVAYEDKMPIAVCRVFKDDDKQSYIIGRIAVIKEKRDKHIGAKILSAAEECIKANGGDCSMLSAQVRVRDFYSKQGYVAEGDVYLDEGCPHITMKKNFAKLSEVSNDEDSHCRR